MKPLLLLHHRADCNTNDIWRAAIQAGWSTERVDMAGRVIIPEGTPKVRYYGNTLHMEMIERFLPIRCLPLDLTVLASTPLTKRRVRLMRAEELGHLTEVAFIKPAQNKWFPAKVYEAGDSPKRSQGGAGLPSDLIYVQEPVDMINEIRCFCLDGKIHTASYYRIGHEYCPLGIDEVDRPKVLDDMVAELAPYYPRGVVLDFAYTRYHEWVFLEPNEAWASGIYGCDPVKCLEVIEASQEEKR
jgi:hypothetical protein